MGDFFGDTAPVADPLHPGRYGCTLGGNWSAFFVFGGATLAAAVRAMGAHVHRPDLQPVGIQALYLQPVEPGAVIIDVETLRSGRSMHQLSAVLSPPGGEAALRVQGTWGGHEPDPATGLGVRCPDVPPPDDPVLRPPRHSPEFGHLPINGQFDERHCPGSAAPGALVDPEMDASSVVWTRLGGDHHDERQPFDPALFALYADRVPGPHLGATITDHPSIEVPPRALVTLEATLRIIGVPSTDWVLLEGVIPEAAGRYVTIRANMWDEAGRLVAIADQTARFAATEVKQPDR